MLNIARFFTLIFVFHTICASSGDVFRRNYAHRRWSQKRTGSGAARRQSPGWKDRADPGVNDTTVGPDILHEILPTPPPQNLHDQCQTDCLLTISNFEEVRSRFEDLTEGLSWKPTAHLVHFTVNFIDYELPVLESFPYMENSWRASEWVWTGTRHGRRLLELPIDADVLSLYLLDRRWTNIDVKIKSETEKCFLLHSAECRLHEIRKLLIYNVTSLPRDDSGDFVAKGNGNKRREYLCHHVINRTTSDIGRTKAELMYRCCKIRDFTQGDIVCRTYLRHGTTVWPLYSVIYIIAIVVTLCSPLILLRIKMALKFDSVTKFFRASLKHGITGQRNYVIRISSRQLINLRDTRPYSLPRAIFRLIFHCYGEGRCCIHWWCEWSEQPGPCRKASFCRRCWFVFCKILAIIFLYPIVFHLALALYAPKLSSYHSLINNTLSLDIAGAVNLCVNPIATALLPAYSMFCSLWSLFSFGSFIYIVILLSWPDNPLERCLLRYEGGKKMREQPALLRKSILHSYKQVLQRLAYGEYRTKRHFFRIPCLPWGAWRVMKLLWRTITQVPVLHICAATFLYDLKLFGNEENSEDGNTNGKDVDEAVATLSTLGLISVKNLCNKCLATIIWMGFVLLLSGYCTAIFLMTVFLLSVIFYVCLGIFLYSSILLPWIAFVIVLIFYTNDVLAAINSEHCYILNLIDENSPRISATEDLEEEIFRDGGSGVQILKSHNLGAVKFIDGDNTEYVSKELYYNVCADLRQGWTAVIRRVSKRFIFISSYSLFIFMTLQNVNIFVSGSESLLVLIGIGFSALPKLLEIHQKSTDSRPDRKTVWARLIPDILDRHIRVDRTRCVDDAEEALTTYDVRPIGVMDIDLPRFSTFRTLQLWKFPWVVSGDQQTQSSESFTIALSNKLSAAAVLARAVSRGLSFDLYDENVMRQWCKMIESCILESSATATSIDLNQALDPVNLFPPEFRQFSSQFDAGNTIDQAVDEINRYLYEPYTRGILITVGSTACAMFKSTVNNHLLTFNSSCHGDQVTDLYGAVLIAAEFNTQNIQLILKFLIDTNRPDSVPVYCMIPVEAFLFRSTEIYDIESSI